MHFTSLTLRNIRCYTEFNIKLSRSINLFVGPNNNGKSTILGALHFFQDNFLNVSDIRVGNREAEINIGFDGDDLYKIKSTLSLNENSFKGGNQGFQKILTVGISTGGVKKKIPANRSGAHAAGFLEFPQVEPDNLIYPFLSKRKVVSYNENVNLQSAVSVKGNFENLYAKIDRLCNEDFKPAAAEYKKACLDIFGYRISAISSSSGKKAAFIIRNFEHIPITSMGEGIVNILGLVVDLCLAEHKIFLIEELENDIHPKALKALLNLIVEKSKSNQFFISTHSNIIVKYLGAENATKIFKIAMNFESTEYPIPTSTISEVSKSEEERRLLLEDLGYEFNDFGLWEAWLFLEESSLEKIINNYLIPWFCPFLKNKLRTYSTGGVTEVEPKFRDFNNLFVYLHLTPNYKNRAWVIVDAGDKEKEIIEKMKQYYVERNQWNADNFLQLSMHDSEEYYPEIFSDEFKELSNLSKDEKRNGKKLLLEKVIAWIEDDEPSAKQEFKESANEIISVLKKIEKAIKNG